MPRLIGKPFPAYPPFLRDGRGHCMQVDPPDLFTDYGDRGAARRDRIAQAKAVCAGCPFRVPCATWAMDTNQTGVWGGMSDVDRQATRRKARNGYRRKEAA